MASTVLNQKYLKNYSEIPASPSDVEGILLYPTVDENFDFCYEILGFPIRVVTLNLNQHWKKIHTELLTLVRLINERQDHPRVTT